MSFQNVTSEDPQIICDMFAFLNPCTFDTSGIDTILDISGIDITENDVEIALRELVGKTSISSDGLATVVLKNCCFSISLLLYLLFNESLTHGQFLDDWKISEMVPIHNSGSKQDICNYRPICKILLIPKLFQKLFARNSRL